MNWGVNDGKHWAVTHRSWPSSLSTYRLPRSGKEQSEKQKYPNKSKMVEGNKAENLSLASAIYYWAMDVTTAVFGQQ